MKEKGRRNVGERESSGRQGQQRDKAEELKNAVLQFFFPKLQIIQFSCMIQEKQA